MKYLLLLIAVLVAGCIQIGEKSQAQNYYLLESQKLPEAHFSTSTNFSSIAIESVDLALFLDKPYVVLYNHKNQVSYPQGERWAEPLNGNISRVIRTNLLNSFGNISVTTGPWEKHNKDALKIKIKIDDFSIHTENKAQISIFYQLTYQGTNVIKQFHKSVITDASITQQITGLNASLNQFCAELSSEIMAITSQGNNNI